MRQRRLLGAAGGRRPDLRPAHRRAMVNGVVTRDPFAGQHHPAEPAEPDRAERPAVTIPLPTVAANADMHAATTSSSSRGPTATTSRWCASTTSGRAPNRTYGRWMRNFRREERYNLAGVQNGVNDHAGRHRSLQPELRVRPHGGALADDWFSTSRAAGCASTTT